MSNAAKKIEVPELPPFMKESDSYITLKFSGKLENIEDAKAFEIFMKTYLAASQKNFIMNCETLSDIGSFWLGTLVRFHAMLKKVNKKIRLIQASEDLRRMLNSQGLQNSLVCVENMHQAMVDFGLAPAKAIDVNFINPFLNAAIDVLRIQCKTVAKPGTPYRKKSDEKFSGDISGVIGLVSPSFNGSVVISFSEATFLSIISRMLGETFTQINKDIEDGAGELTNIIFGQAKVTLNELGYGIKTALPSVVTGANHSVLQMTNGPRVVVPFETDVGPFLIEICTITAD